MKESAEETIFEYLARHGPQSTFRIARELGIARESVVDVLKRLSKEGRIEFRRGLAIALKKIPSKLKVTKPKKIKRPKIKPKLKKPVAKRIKVKRVAGLKVKKEVIKEVPRIIQKKVVKEVIPEEKLEELETKIEAKLGGRVGGVKEALTSKIKELADTELNLAAKLKELEKKISELEARPAVKPRILKQFKVPKELKEKIEELSKKLLEFKKPAVPKPEPKKTEVEEAKPKKAEKKKFWFKPKPLPSPAEPVKPQKPKIEKKGKARIKLKLPKLKMPEVKIPKLFRLLKPKKTRIKPRPKLTKKKRGKGFFARAGEIGETKLFSKRI